jgi:hypothetical protein
MGRAVWMSDLKNNFKLGDRPGVRTKYFEHDWQPAEFKVPLAPDDVHANMRRAALGFALTRRELPEAAAIWDLKRFKTLGDVFYAGGFLVVRGKLSETLSRFDLGEGGLVPFPVYQADLETPYPGAFFLLNFGCIKDTLLPEQCENARKFLIRKATGVQVWHINDSNPDAKVVLSPQALGGPDLWFEEAAHNKIFMSDELGQALQDIGMGEVFGLTRCQVL